MMTHRTPTAISRAGESVGDLGNALILPAERELIRGAFGLWARVLVPVLLVWVGLVLAFQFGWIR